MNLYRHRPGLTQWKAEDHNLQLHARSAVRSILLQECLQGCWLLHLCCWWCKHALDADTLPLCFYLLHNSLLV